MSEMIIKAGKFFKDGNFIQPIFGDQEQINCLRKFNENIGSLQKEGLIVHPDYMTQIDADAIFDCICGKRLNKMVGADYEDDIDCFINQKVTCNECNRTYIFKSDEDDNLIVKLS